MPGETSIGWTDATWNPTVGCSRVSAGCMNCYAKTLHDQRAFPGYNRVQTYSTLKARASRLVGMEAENKAISTTAHYEAVMSTIAELLPLDAADRGEAPQPEDE